MCLRPKNKTMKIARGIVRAKSGSVKPVKGISTTSQINITGILIGGATIPRMAPKAMMAPTLALGMPILIIIGATKAPDVTMQERDEPVIMPGNMIINIRHTKRILGER